MKRIMIAVLATALLSLFLCSCGEDTADVTKSSDESVVSSAVESTASKTVSIASVEPKLDLPWPDAEVLQKLPALSETVDYYVDPQAGGAEGTYNIQLADMEYSEFRDYVNGLLENGFEHWTAPGEMVLPEELAEGESAFCPVTDNETLWGVIEYRATANGEGNKIVMVFNDSNPYSGY